MSWCGSVIELVVVNSFILLVDNQKLFVRFGEAGTPGNGTKDVGNGRGIEGILIENVL